MGTFPSKRVFVPERLIYDNVLLAYEILHSFRQKRARKKGFMALKLDMRKPYDRVKWGFLRIMMERMGFDNDWVNLIMTCITSVLYSVFVSDMVGEVFIPSRGFPQGDPLSVFLFLICSEGLSTLMKLALNKGLMKGAKVNRRGPQITHLLFADNCVLFCEAIDKGAQTMKRVLSEYEVCSGQCINYEKSTIFFSSNTSERDRVVVSRTLGVKHSNDIERYLGLPNLVRMRKKMVFQGLNDQFRKKNDNWSMRFLSQ